VLGHEVQFHTDAQSTGSRDPAGGRRAGARVHTTRTGRLLALVEVLSLRRLCADVYRTGRGGPRHSTVPIHVRRGWSEISVKNSCHFCRSVRTLRPPSSATLEREFSVYFADI